MVGRREIGELRGLSGFCPEPLGGCPPETGFLFGGMEELRGVSEMPAFPPLGTADPECCGLNGLREF